MLIMAEIRNLTRNGETFYPLTHAEGILDPDGEYIGYYTDNPEWIKVILDNDKKILAGIKSDGSVEWILGVPQPIKDYIQENIIPALLNKVDKEEGKSLINSEVASSFNYKENPEYLSVELDSEEKVLGGRKKDGTKLENIGIDLNGTLIKSTEDLEHRLSIVTDSSNRIVSYRDKNGTLHENVGIECPNIKTENVEFGKEAENQIRNLSKEAQQEMGNVEKKYHIPSYGTVNLKEETFYLTADNRYSNKEDVQLIQMYDDTQENRDKTLSYYYIKSTLTPLPGGGYDRTSVTEDSVRLTFYAAGLVSKVGSKYYVTSTLEGGTVVGSSIEVTQLSDIPPYKAWAIDKNEHYCITDINLGYYLNLSDISVGIKYQGQSTMGNRKRNFRLTFYKSGKAKPYYPVDDDKFGKKEKIKIGEMVRLSGYNLKANWSDNTRVKEIILYATILSVWEQRPLFDRFPWDKEFGYYTGATGFIKGFPISTYIGGEFYGMQTFCLKKDERNYMLDGDDDHSGIFVCGLARGRDNWKSATAGSWEDEMMDSMSQETTNALNTFMNYINSIFVDSSDNRYTWNQLTFFINDISYTYRSVYLKEEKLIVYVDGAAEEITDVYVTSTLNNGVPTENSVKATFNGLLKDEIDERMDVLGWIDYFICMQTFLMWDSICRNMILHTRSDKKKFYPYFYDLDLSLNHSYDADIFDIAADTIDGKVVMNDMSLWYNIKNMYWDEIVNRYCELRNTVLNIENIRHIYHLLTDSIPDSDYENENRRWGTSVSRSNSDALLDKIDSRLKWLDENYFIV